MRIREDIKRALENAGYGIYNHSAVQVCFWTKKAIRGEATCYKNKFYGIDTHRCMQISLAAAWCTNRCIYCWRPNERFMPGTDILPEDEVDPPGVALERLKELRKKLLSGFGGDPRVDRRIYEEALEPSHVTFSLSGEPLLYPFMVEAIEYIRENGPQVRSIFVVSNGLVPEQVERMKESGVWPTQFYVSLTAPTPELYKKISRPLVRDYWDRLLRTLDILRDAPVRKVARITLIRGLNDVMEEKWAELIERMNPHFVEVKAYMYLGLSRRRLREENMPEHAYVVEWTKKLLAHLPGFDFWKEDEPSRIAVLKNRRPGMDIDPIIRSVYPNLG